MKERQWLYYYGGVAFSERLNAKVRLVMIARNDEEAEIRYRECITRHPHLKALDDPHICVGGGDEGPYHAKGMEKLKKYK